MWALRCRHCPRFSAPCLSSPRRHALLVPRARYPARQRRLLRRHGSLSRSRQVGATTLLAACGGVTAFAIADVAIDGLLRRCGSEWPSSVAGIIGLGALSMHPKVGSIIYAALGPGAAWLRAGLPIFLAPVILAPMVVPLPPMEEFPRLLLLSWVSILGSVAFTGHVARIGLLRASSSVTVRSINTSPMASAAEAACDRLFSSWAGVGAFLGLGGAVSAATWAWQRAAVDAEEDTHTRAGDAGPRASSIPDAQTPLLIGASFSAYMVCAKLTPKALRLVFPPTVASGALLGAVLWSIGGAPQIRRYLDGAGAAMLKPVSPAMISLGLLVHTHRPLLRAAWRPLLIACVLSAPLGMVATAHGGAALQLSPAITAALLPASTTTGLAMTMDIGGLAPSEWVPLGPLIFGVSGMVTWPLLMRIGGLTAAGPVVQGFALGAVSHVAGMAALLAAGEAQAAAASVLGFFMLGTTRCVFVQFESFEALLHSICSNN